MINGLSTDITSRGAERTSRQGLSSHDKPPAIADGRSFADQLFGREAGEMKSPDRSKRQSFAAPEKADDLKPGRVDSSNDERGGRRLNERDSGPNEAKEFPGTNTSRKRPFKNIGPADDERMTGTASVEAAGGSQRGGWAADASAPSTAAALRERERSEAAAETVSLLEDIRREGESARLGAMENFMARMRSEFGVSPEQVLQAFANLDEATMMGAPERTVGEFLAQLPILPEQERRASEIYQEMVGETGQAALNELFGRFNEGVKIEVLSQKDARLRRLNQSIDELNTTFSLRGPNAGEDLTARINQLMIEKRSLHQRGDSMRPAPVGADSALTASQSHDVGIRESGGLALFDKGADARSGAGGQGLSDFGAAQTAADAVAGAGGFSDVLSGGSGDGSGGGAGVASSAASSTLPGDNASRSTLFAGQMRSAEARSLGEGASTESVSSEGGLSEGGLIGGEEAQMAGAGVIANQEPGGATRPATRPSEMMVKTQPTPQEEAENIRELIKQAQVVMKRGGGEMKLEMKPEGMGQVRLNVNVENGQVNIQMLTDNEAAKRLLENGLSELRTSLAAHHLKVEMMRVDLSGEMQRHMEQGHQDAAREQARQFAEGFMGQFRDERQSFRQGLFEDFGSRTYRRTPNRAAIEPEPVGAAGPARASGGSRRLNLVA